MGWLRIRYRSFKSQHTSFVRQGLNYIVIVVVWEGDGQGVLGQGSWSTDIPRFKRSRNRLDKSSGVVADRVSCDLLRELEAERTDAS